MSPAGRLRTVFRAGTWSLTLAVAALSAATILAPATGPESASPAPAPAPGWSGPFGFPLGGGTQAGVSSAEYHLGDEAFTVPGTGGARAELTGIVHYPTRLTPARHPVVVMLHGWWDSCADAKASRAEKAAEKAGDTAEALKQRGFLRRWPCRPGVSATESYRGFDYLGEQLARRGFLAISLSADGLNSADPGGADGDRARAALIDAHLTMWRQLTTSGTGPLAGHLTLPDSRRPATVDFRDRLDLLRVGTLGHSAGARAVHRLSSVAHRKDLPAGVSVKAVLPLAAPFPTLVGDPEQALTAPDIPFMTTFGTCDRGHFTSVREGDAYYHEAVDRPVRTATVRTLHLRGGNHNSFNSRWSPSSGLPSAADDARHAGPPGTCVSDDDGSPSVTQLSETAQRRTLVTYAVAFFERYLNDDTSAEALLNDARRPFGPQRPVDIAVTAPTRTERPPLLPLSRPEAVLRTP